MRSTDTESTEQSQLPNGLDFSDDEEDELKPFRRERDDYLFKYEGLANIFITTGLLIGAHLGLVSIWWLFGFFALTIIPPEFNKVRTHGIKKYLDVLKFKRPTLKDVGIMVLGLVGIIGLLIGATYILTTIIPNGTSAVQEGGHLISEATVNVWIWAGAVIVMYLIVGPLEEYFFRHQLQNWLKDKSTFVGAIIGTNVIFSLLHLPVLVTGGDSLSYIVPLVFIMVLGIIFSLQYEYTDNLAVPALTHSTYNSLIITFLFVHQTGVLS